MNVVHGKSAGAAAALVIFCIFAMSVFSILMLGVSAYGNIAETSRKGAEDRACLSYIWTKVKNGDDAGKVFVRDFDGVPALWIEENLGSFVYYTVIYSHDGWIYELFTENIQGFSLGDGVSVVKNESLMLLQYTNGLIMASAGYESVLIFPRGNVTASADSEIHRSQEMLEITESFEMLESLESSEILESPESSEMPKITESSEILEPLESSESLHILGNQGEIGGGYAE